MDLDSQKKYDRPIIKCDQPDDRFKIQQLPPPTGNYPYRLELEKLMPIPKDKFSFHMVGDTGGMLYPESQQKIAAAMQEQAREGAVTDPFFFLYHLGDIVYHYGEAEHYERQFFKPYADYPRPIFAIAGNHDSDINPNNPIPYGSLDAFKVVFCDSESRKISFAKNEQRNSMVQPNILLDLANAHGYYHRVAQQRTQIRFYR